MLKIIYIDFDNLKDKIDKSIGQDSGNHSNNDNNNSTKYDKFIKFFVNNRSSHFKQLTTTIETI